MKHIRPDKNRKTLQRLKVKQVLLTDTKKEDEHIIDVVLKTLYSNSDKNAMHLEEDIYKPSNIRIPAKESERLWEVLISSGLIKPIVGFGNSGKVALSNSGYQLMAAYGGYHEYLKALQENNSNNQTFILPFQVQEDNDANTSTGNKTKPKK